VGIERVLEALASNSWPTLVLKDKTSIGQETSIDAQSSVVTGAFLGSALGALSFENDEELESTGVFSRFSEMDGNERAKEMSQNLETLASFLQ